MACGESEYSYAALRHLLLVREVRFSDHARNHPGSIMFVSLKPRSNLRHGVRACALLCLFVVARASLAAPVFRCTDAHGRIAFQAEPCAVHAEQAAIEIREQPLIDPGAAARPAVRIQRGDTTLSHDAHGRRVLSHRARKPSQPTSWECVAADGEVFYRHAHCPHSVPGDGVTRSDTVTSAHRRGSRARTANALGAVRVSARKVPRAQACGQINATAAVDRDGSTRDERVSVYEHNMGRDPCAVY